MSFTQDIQQLEPGQIIQLLEVDGTAFGMDNVLRFHSHNIPSDGWASFAADNLP
ncbi:MAG: phage minor tail protein L, partial [Mixta calida]|nr:phage minor tail protein L [Mixta calida]